MKLESFKKQASRLAAYLSENHRVKLKHASALEAIAVVHGVRNWQTLAAQAETADASSQAPMAIDALLPLTWHPDGRPHIAEPSREWARHGLACGELGQVRDWTREQAGIAMSAGFGAIVFETSASAAPYYSDDVVVLDLSGPDIQVIGKLADVAGINIVKGLSETQLTSLASVMAPGRPEEFRARCQISQAFSQSPAAYGLRDLLERAVAIVVVLPQHRAETWAQFWMYLLTAAVRGHVTPWVLALPSIEPFYGPGLSAIAEQGRAMGCFLRAGVNRRSLTPKDARSVRVVNLNAFHHVDLRSVAERTPDMLEKLAQSPASCMSGGTYRF